MTYFSERKEEERPRESIEIAEAPWGGIRTLIRARIADGSFSARYDETCRDSSVPAGTDESAFWLAMRGENPAFQKHVHYGLSEESPRTLYILDLID